MVPSLKGRWLTRILLFLWIGVPVTFLFSLFAAGPGSPRLPLLGWHYEIVPFQILSLLLIVGLIMDMVYIYFQQWRWERDWPFALFFFFSIIEFVIVLGLVWWGVLDFVRPRNASPHDYTLYVIHFACVFIPSFIAVLGIIQIFMIRWRFKGGEWGRL
ncbi:MAG: hypothetical protein KF794_11100 [Xanthobacteraceae bacterium]|nr:hypothetical protein [Xanthobacteraceae bacterium]QYK44326.1 MAG: hypothetical protein KF794_11100 [Xanthobacteraceae bacterium]